MKGKGLIITALAFTLLPVASPNAQEYPKLTLRFAHFVPATLPGATVDQWFAEELSKRTKGQVTMQFFWAESGGKSMEAAEALSPRRRRCVRNRRRLLSVPDSVPCCCFDPGSNVGPPGKSRLDYSL